MQLDLNDNNKQDWIHAQKIKRIYAGIYTSATLAIISAVLLVVLLSQRVAASKLWVWLVMAVLCAVLRLILAYYYHKRQDTKSIHTWEALYKYTLIPYAIAWSLGIVWLIYDADFMGQVFGYSFLVGGSGAALTWYMPLRKVVFSVLTAFLLPVTIMFLLKAELESVFLACAGSALLISLLRVANVQYKDLNYMLDMAYENNQAKLQAQHLASTDSLTGLNNRRAFFEQSESLASYCERYQLPISFIMFDIDHFKSVNDTYGHSIGDKMLVEVAGVVQNLLRKSDVFCRMGGEEFAIILPNTPLDQAVNLAERLRVAIEAAQIETMQIETMQKDDPQVKTSQYRTLHVTASFGVANDHYNVDAMLQHADEAMYVAKHLGRNRVQLYQPAASEQPPSALG